jgi:hypothetical protein
MEVGETPNTLTLDAEIDRLVNVHYIVIQQNRSSYRVQHSSRKKIGANTSEKA